MRKTKLNKKTTGVGFGADFPATILDQVCQPSPGGKVKRRHASAIGPRNEKKMFRRQSSKITFSPDLTLVFTPASMRALAIRSLPRSIANMSGVAPYLG